MFHEQGLPNVLLSSRIEELEDKYGGLRAAARALRSKPSYLSRLKSGERTNPSDAVLKKLGLKKVVFYVPIV